QARPPERKHRDRGWNLAQKSALRAAEHQLDPMATGREGLGKIEHRTLRTASYQAGYEERNRSGAVVARNLAAHYRLTPRVARSPRLRLRSRYPYIKARWTVR